VTNTDRAKLLFGLYPAPPLKRGDRAECLFRDAAVVITGWSDAPIPWPRCRTLDSPGGGSGLLVDKVLAWAVRHESAAAITFGWGASSTAVGHWRRALGVTRTGNNGTARLTRAASEKGADVLRGQQLPPAFADRQRRTAVEKNLGQHLAPGYHGPRWTPQGIALLGTLPDEEVAQWTGRTLEAVRPKRGGGWASRTRPATAGLRKWSPC
jgi:hypothetical protein